MGFGKQLASQAVLPYLHYPGFAIIPRAQFKKGLLKLRLFVFDRIQFIQRLLKLNPGALEFR